MSVSIRGQFQRSIQLVRDFYSARDSSGYIVTSKALETTSRLVGALATPGSPRAWSISGPYGGGKSAYALFAAQLMRGDVAASRHLAASDADLAEQWESTSPGAFCPVLVVGSRSPLTQALAEGLARSLDTFASAVPAGKGRASTCAKQAMALAGQARMATTEPEVTKVYDEAAALVAGRTGGGLFVIVDELGKHLEYAALHPGDGDLFVLQSLAERAAKAGAPPLFVVTVLHQAFERYAVGLSSKQRDDWRKVQGRFEDVAFIEPVGETLRLLAEAVEADLPAAVLTAGQHAIEAVVGAASLRARLDVREVSARLEKALPLHPSVALLVGPLFRRLAQNERSLFSFLASGEPQSFLAVMGEEAEGLYRLDHLYDYLTGTLGGALYHDGAGRLWAETEAALARVAGKALEERMLKQVAVLCFAGSLAGLLPTEDLLIACSGVNEEKAREALHALRGARVVAYRPFHKEYRVWEGSDFDLAGALAEARAAVPLNMPLASLLAQTAPPEPIVARRHAFETGTTRLFEVVYADGEAWRALIEQAPKHAEGRVVYVLAEQEGEEAVAADLTKATAGRGGMHLFYVPRGTSGLHDLARDLAALDQVRRSSMLDGDKVARREIDEQRADLRAALDHRLAGVLSPSRGTWVRAGERVALSSDGDLQRLLSDACDEAFPRAPRVQSELLNRRQPSSSAVRAQKLLLKAMTANPHLPRLGIEGTPAEYALYASILQKTGLHQEVEPGRWAFVPAGAPGIEPGTAAAVAALTSALQDARQSTVSVSDLYDVLLSAPFGVREGLLPVFLFAVLVRLGDDVAVFEDGVYQWSLSFEAVERLLRGPGAFSLQWVGASDAQRVALDALAPRVGLSDVGADGVKPLAVVGRVLQSVSNLPAYVRKTSALSDAVVAVREALVHATEPSTLLFRALPEALGLAPFAEETVDDSTRRRADAFADALADALRDLGSAYEDLLSKIDTDIAAAFGLRATTATARRDELARRARALSSNVVDTQLRSFVVRASDELADTRAWTESLAALLARTPPSQWADSDHKRFTSSLRDIAEMFAHREAVSFTPEEERRDLLRTATKFRLSVTATHEEERQTVVSVHDEDVPKVNEIAQQVSHLLSASDVALDTQIAALSQLSLALLERRGGREGSIGELLALLAPSSQHTRHND